MRGLAVYFFSRLAAIAGLVEERPAVETAVCATRSSLATLHFFLNAT
jgi:hypothetical protein